MGLGAQIYGGPHMGGNMSKPIMSPRPRGPILANSHIWGPPYRAPYGHVSFAPEVPPALQGYHGNIPILGPWARMDQATLVYPSEAWYTQATLIPPVHPGTPQANLVTQATLGNPGYPDNIPPCQIALRSCLGPVPKNNVFNYF